MLWVKHQLFDQMFGRPGDGFIDFQVRNSGPPVHRSQGHMVPPVLADLNPVLYVPAASAVEHQ